MEVSDAKVLVTANATLRRGKPIPMKEQVDAVLDDLPKMEHVVVVKRADTDTPMKDGRDVWWHEACEKVGRRLPGRAARRRAPALHPLHVGLDREAEGHPAHDRRLPDRRRPPRTKLVFDLKPRHRRVLVRGRHRLGHRPQLHRLRAALQRRDVGDVRGRARLPGQGPLVGDRREVQGHDPLHRADRDPRVHQVGPRVPGEARPLVAAAARLGRRADQPARLDLVPAGDRRRALPDRRHVVADRDRPDHDHAAARASPRRSRAPRRARSPASRRRS